MSGDRFLETEQLQHARLHVLDNAPQFVKAGLDLGTMPAETARKILASLEDLKDEERAEFNNKIFGAEFDSFADWISFGLAPGLMAYELLLKSYGKLGFLLAFFYVFSGAFRLAIEENLPLIPMVISGTQNILPKHSMLLSTHANIKLQVLDAIPAGTYTLDQLDEFKQTVRDQILK